MKGKNTRLFCQKPIVWYTVKAYTEFMCRYGADFSEIRLAVNTDSQLLIDQLIQMEVDFIPIARESFLAGDVVSKYRVIQSTLKKTEEICGMQFPYVVDLDITSPLRTPENIKGTLDTLCGYSGADISFSVTSARRSPYFNMVCCKENGFYDRVIQSDFVTRQQVPVCYDMNASIYAYDREYLLSGREHDRKAVIYEMKDTAILDIDGEEDLELLEVIASYLIKKDDYYNIFQETGLEN